MNDAERQQKYRAEHRDYCRALQRKYYHNAPHKSRERVTRWRANNPWAHRLRHIRERCSNPKDVGYKNYGAKGIRCFLTRLDLKQLWKRDNAGALKSPVVDRLNPKGHYTMKNCRFIERSANASKGNSERKSYA